jgi:hypothetical protein
VIGVKTDFGSLALVVLVHQTGAAFPTLGSVEAADSQQSDQTNRDQINGHDQVQKLGHNQDENSCQERDQGGQTDVKVHGISKVVDCKKETPRYRPP